MSGNDYSDNVENSFNKYISQIFGHWLPVTRLTKNDRGDFVRGPAVKTGRIYVINRPRRDRNSGSKRFVLVWEPRNPDVTAIIKSNSHAHYRDPINRRDK